jgi:hypothetical protein
MSAKVPARQRVWIPGTRLLGGCSVWLRTDAPHDLDEPWGTLAEPARLRDVDVPAGSTIGVDVDFDDITITLSEATTVRGNALPPGTTLKLRGRVVGFPGLALTFLLLFLMPWFWWSRRRYARVIEVIVNQNIDISGRGLRAGARFAIRADGTITTDPTV